MNQPAADLWSRLDAANDLPPGIAKITAIEELVNRADLEQLPDLQFATRMGASNAYQYGGEPAKAFVSFSWCLAAYDRGEGVEAYTHSLFWHFKWMVSSLTRFPEVPLTRTYAVLDDMQRRYRLAGHGMNPVHQHRNEVAMHIGDAETAAEQYRLWLAAPRTGMSDCIGCEPTSKVDYLASCGRDEEAVEIGAGVLSGRFTCIEQPHGILTSLLLPYLRTGRLEEAARAHRNAYRAIQANRAEMGMVASHLQFCALSGNHARGLQLVERHLGWLRQPPTPLYEMTFAASAAGVLGKVIAAGHADTAVRRSAGEESTVAALRDELAERATALAAKFDARNGTEEQSKQIADLISAPQLVDYLPLSGPIRKARHPTPAPAEPAKPPTPTDPDALIALAEHQYALWDTTAATATWATFDEICPDPTPTQLARRLNALANDQARTDPADAEATWLRAAELFASTGEEAWSQSMHGRIAFLWATTGRTDEALAKGRAAAARINEIGTDADRAKSAFRLAGILGLAGQLDETAATLADAAALAEQADERELQAAIALQRSNLLANQGREALPQAIELARRATAHYAGYEPSTALRTAQLQLGTMLTVTGDARSAEATLAQAALSPDPELRAEANRLRGRIAVGSGQDELAYDLISAAIPDLGGLGVGYARVDLAAAALNLEKPEEAAESAEDALSDLEKSGDIEEIARARFLLAKSYRALNQPDQAIDLLAQVRNHCAAAQNWSGVGQMHSLSGDILDREDRDAQAAEHYAAAASAYRDAGMGIEELTSLRRSALSWHWAQNNATSLETLAAADKALSRLPAEEPPVIWHTALLDYDAARIFANTEQPAKALPRIESARLGFAALDAAEQVTVAEVLQGRILIELNRATEAETLLKAALGALPATARERRQQVTELLSSIHNEPPTGEPDFR